MIVIIRTMLDILLQPRCGLVRAEDDEPGSRPGGLETSVPVNNLN